MYKRFIAVASIRHKGEVVGARVISYNGANKADLTNKQLIELMNCGRSIRNLRVVNGEVKWVQGSADRYPALESKNLQMVTNRDAIVVIARYKDNYRNRIMFKVANYKGQIVDLESDRLIKYGKQYTLSNCKITSKDNVEYVASISGELYELNSEPRFRYCDGLGLVSIAMPEAPVEVIELPEVIDRLYVNDLKEIEIVPRHRAKEVKKLVIHERIKELTSKQLKPFVNLEELAFKGIIKEYTQYPLVHNKKLKRVYIGGIDSRATGLFYNLKELKSVTYGRKPATIYNYMYHGCVSLDMDGILHPNIISIEKMAFRGCGQFTKVELPGSIRSVHISAFNDCYNLREFVIKEVTTELIDDSNSEHKLLEGTHNIVLRCPYEYSKRLIEDKVAEHVIVKRDEPKDISKVAKNRALKARVLGGVVRECSMAETVAEAAGFMDIISDEMWEEQAIKLVRQIVKHKEYGLHHTMTNGIGQLRVTVCPSTTWPDKRSRKAILGRTKSWMFIRYDHQITVIVLDRKRVKEFLESRDRKIPGHRVSANVRLGRAEGDPVVVEIPSLVLRINDKAIERVYEDNDGNLNIDLNTGITHRIEF